jgi:hypothetical protein
VKIILKGAELYYLVTIKFLFKIYKSSLIILDLEPIVDFITTSRRLYYRDILNLGILDLEYFGRSTRNLARL